MLERWKALLAPASGQEPKASEAPKKESHGSSPEHRHTERQSAEDGENERALHFAEELAFFEKRRPEPPKTTEEGQALPLWNWTWDLFLERMRKVTAADYQAEVEHEAANLRRHWQAYLDPESDQILLAALSFSVQMHHPQRRMHGEPYCLHPISVCDLLTELEVERATLIAALLHDTVEDTPLTAEQLAHFFGSEVAALVDGVTKLDKFQFNSKEELQAENFRKMFLAMAKDIRVIWIKLSDRMHNMRTMKYMRRDKQVRIAQETLDIYAPLSSYLGIYRWKWELEDLCLRYLDPGAYYELVGAISQRRSEREQYLAQVVEELTEAIHAIGIDCEIEGRPKHFYSIYRKMKLKDKHLDQIYDLFACRVIVQTVADCYAVLGQVHEMYKPMPGRVKDYIAMPKPNMYQSLHTTVIGPRGVPFEVQIRTLAMHRTAEYGLAAHWKYKQSGNRSISADQHEQEEMASRLTWLRQLLDWQKDMRDASEYIESLKNGLIAEQVFVFTPRGDVLSLPKGATPIDFAYAIHSGIGNHMFGAKVNGRIAPLTYELQNGDFVEVLTSDKVNGPSRDWLKIVKSSSARNKINQWFKKASREEDIQRGKDMLEREIRRSAFTPSQLMKPAYVEAMLERQHLKKLEDLYASIGHGTLTAQKVVPKLREAYIRDLSPAEQAELGYRVNGNGQLVYDPEPAMVSEDGEIIPTKAPRRHSHNEYGIIVAGMDNCLVTLSRCCKPVPGDPIVGFVKRGRGVSVHRQDCRNIRNILAAATGDAANAEQASRLIDVYWDDEEPGGQLYRVELRILAHDRHHLLGDISNAIADERVPILSGTLNAYKDITASLHLIIEIQNQAQLDRIIGRIKAVKDVFDVQREQ